MTKLAADAGIPLVYVNRQPTDVDQLGPKAAFVASNEADSGTLETKEVCKLLGGKGDILVMVGDLANQAAVQRTKDIHDVIATPECAGMKILDEQTAVWDPVKAQDLMTNWISAGMKPAAVISNNDNMAIGAIQAMKAAGWDMKNVVVGGVDATQEALAAMKAGDLDVTVFQNAAGQGNGAARCGHEARHGRERSSTRSIFPSSSSRRPTWTSTSPRTRLDRCADAPPERRRSPCSSCETRSGKASACSVPSTMKVVRESGAVPNAEYLLEVEDVRKEFPGVLALDDVQFRLRRGTVHALMGENGAGKSTLMKIIAGIYTPDRGSFRLRGEEIRLNSPLDALENGIAMIHQELNLMAFMTVAENIWIRREPMNRFGFVDHGAAAPQDRRTVQAPQHRHRPGRRGRHAQRRQPPDGRDRQGGLLRIPTSSSWTSRPRR